MHQINNLSNIIHKSSHVRGTTTFFPDMKPPPKTPDSEWNMWRLLALVLFVHAYRDRDNSRRPSLSQDHEEQRGQVPVFNNLQQSSTLESVTPTWLGRIVVFFNVYVSPNSSTLAASGVAAAQDQLHQMLQSKNARDAIQSIRIVRIGANTTLHSHRKCSMCKRIKHVPKGSEAETLNELYGFCNQNPGATVAYVHNKGSLHPSPGAESLRQFLTKGVVSDACLGLAKNDAQSLACTTCSSRFSAGPHFHTPGNMWVARCDYVRLLRPPNEFEADMDQLLSTFPWDMTKVRHAWWKDKPWMWGAGRYSAEHYIHSHPNAVPCDLYDNQRFISGTSGPGDDAWIPQLKMPLRYSLAAYNRRPRKHLSWQAYQWKQLYGKLPPSKSWIWKVYPSSEIRFVKNLFSSTLKTDLLGQNIQLFSPQKRTRLVMFHENYTV